jgi:hypothetical protein
MQLPFNAEDCLAADPFASDFGSPGDRTFKDKITKARVGGPCHWCDKEIKPGEVIRLRTDLSEGVVCTYRWCTLCCKAMAKSWTDDGKAWERRAH